MFNIFKKKYKNRKEKNEAFLSKMGIKVNHNLPSIEDDLNVNIKTPKEVAERVVIMILINYFVFDTLDSNEAIQILKKRDLWNKTSPKEKILLQKPTEDKKRKESWKCECIYALMWALKAIPELNFPATMCNLDDIPGNKYPLVIDEDPNIFINNIKESRSKEDIMDMADLYYRIHWAVVDEGLNSDTITIANPNVVYERHYTLNWLIDSNIEWDNVSCDT